MPRRRPVMRGMARTAVVAGTATAVSGRVARRQQGRWQEQAEAEQQAQAPAAPATAASAPAPTAEASTVDELERLGSLYQQGLLTADEFAAEKAKLLAS